MGVKASPGEVHKAVSHVARLCIDGGRGYTYWGLGAAVALYIARRHGTPYSIAYKTVLRHVPKQTLYNSIAILLHALGHSLLFKRVLQGRLGAWVCRRPDYTVEAEYYYTPGGCASTGQAPKGEI